MTTYQLLNTISLGQNIDFMRVHNNHLIIATKEGDISLWDIAQGKRIKRLPYDFDITTLQVYQHFSHHHDLIRRYYFTRFERRYLKKNSEFRKKTFTALAIGNGILAVSFEDVKIKLFGNKADFAKR